MARYSDYHPIRTFRRGRFCVQLCWAYEDDPDFSWDDEGETLRKCQSGEWGCYTFRVMLTLDNREIACDYIGNSVYADPAEFAREHIGINRYREKIAPAITGTYFADMVAGVIAEARKALCNPPRLRCV